MGGAQRLPPAFIKDGSQIAPGGSIVAGLGLWLIRMAADKCLIKRFSASVILNVYTEPAHRRIGISRQLMKTALDWCRENHVNMVILHATEKGRPLYASFGFKPTTEMRLIVDGESIIRQ